MDIPCLYNAETASILFLSMPGVRPNLAPLRRASLRPAEHLSAITERSNSAKAAINDIISFPVALCLRNWHGSFREDPGR